MRLLRLEPAITKLARTLLIALGAAAAITGVAFAAGVPVASERLSTIRTEAPVPAETCTLQAPAADAHVDEANPDLSYGSDGTLHVRSAATSKRTLVRFDIASCSIPQAASIESASLKLFLVSAPTATRTYEVAAATASWTELGLNWTNQPAAAASPTATAATGTTTGAIIDWDVLADVRAIVSGPTPNEGWRVKDAAEGASPAQEAEFGSRENGTTSQRPSLVITYYR